MINIKFYDGLNWFIKINFEGISQKKKKGNSGDKSLGFIVFF